VKNKRSYHKRFQVKWRRRREGKTDYNSRGKLVYQDKRKYVTGKCRLVVRISKRNIICQLISAKLEGDKVLKIVSSKKLVHTPIFMAQNNFPAAYLIGLEMAKKIKHNSYDKGRENQKLSKTPSIILDIGLKRATTGAKVFAVMKGVTDGGVLIPHNEKKFPGFKKGELFDEAALRERIIGEHIMNYIELLKEEDEERLEKQFKNYQSILKHGNIYLEAIKNLNAVS
jgi:large subunit ribosomal protein L5e